MNWQDNRTKLGKSKRKLKKTHFGLDKKQITSFFSSDFESVFA